MLLVGTVLGHMPQSCMNVACTAIVAAHENACDTTKQEHALLCDKDVDHVLPCSAHPLLRRATLPRAPTGLATPGTRTPSTLATAPGATQIQPASLAKRHRCSLTPKVTQSTTPCCTPATTQSALVSTAAMSLQQGLNMPMYCECWKLLQAVHLAVCWKRAGWP